MSTYVMCFFTICLLQWPVYRETSPYGWYGHIFVFTQMVHKDGQFTSGVSDYRTVGQDFV